MSHFKAEMHQIRLRLALCSGSLQCSPDPILDLRGLLLREGEGKGEGRREKGRATSPLFGRSLSAPMKGAPAQVAERRRQWREGAMNGRDRKNKGKGRGSGGGGRKEVRRGCFSH